MEAAVSALAERLRNEIELAEQQLRKSRTARGAASTECPAPSPPAEPTRQISPTTTTTATANTPTAQDNKAEEGVQVNETEDNKQQQEEEEEEKAGQPRSAPPASQNGQPTTTTTTTTACTSGDADAHAPIATATVSTENDANVTGVVTSSSAVVLRPVRETRKSGELLHLVRRSTPFGKDQWLRHYFVVDETQGIVWYNTNSNKKNSSGKASIRDTSAQRPLGRIPFYRTSTNSRGTRFMNAAVCWPLLLPEDCPQANDPALVYFGIEYPEKNEQRAMCALATNTRQVRDDWVCFLTRYIALYLAPRPVSQALQSLPRGAPTPRYTTHVIAGVMTLPIVRLQRTSTRNARYTTDPRQATATLYVFVRSVPTAREVEHAMSRFCASLTEQHRQSVTYTHNARVVQGLQHVVLDELMLREPPVAVGKDAHDTSPHAPWCQLLVPHASHHDNKVTAAAEEHEDEAELVELSALSIPAHAAQPGEAQTVHMSPAHVYDESVRATHDFADPYTAYEAYYARMHARPEEEEQEEDEQTPHAKEHEGSDEENGQGGEPHTPQSQMTGFTRSGSAAETQLSAPSASTLSSSSQQQQQQQQRPHTRTQTPTTEEEQQGQEDREGQDASGAQDAAVAAAAASTPPSLPHTTHAERRLNEEDGEERPMHPLLDALLRRVRHDALAAEEEHSEKDENDEELRASMARTAATLEELTRRVQGELSDSVARGSIWGAAHRHLKSVDGFVTELHTRLAAARRLDAAEQYEKETMQLAHVSLLLEVRSMQLLLRDVGRVVAQARAEAAAARQEGREEGSGHEVEEEEREDAQLMRELEEVLSSFTPP